MTKFDLAKKLEGKNPLRYPYMILMNLSKADLQRVYDREFNVKVLQDTCEYDSRGNVVTFDNEESSQEVIEPYDPAYLTDEKPEFDLSRSEKIYLRKISILSGKLRDSGISSEWEDHRGWFKIAKYVNGSEYPTYRYLWFDTDDSTYCFGTYKEATDWDGNVSVAIDAAKRWLNSKLIRK